MLFFLDLTRGSQIIIHELSSNSGSASEASTKASTALGLVEETRWKKVVNKRNAVKRVFENG